MMKTKFRYPGVNYFKQEDANIFWGRKEDAKRLYTQLMLSNTLVLHAESGVGKSSLIQAGLLPILESSSIGVNAITSKNSYEYLTINLRLDAIKCFDIESYNNQIKSILISKVLDLIKLKIKTLESIELPYLKNVSEDNLWITAKKLQLKGHRLLLIFDQFEELQKFTAKEIKLFKSQLNELLATDIPHSIYNIVKSNTAKLFNDVEVTDSAKEEFNANIKMLETPLKAKILFVIREDKLGTMSLLSDYFPDILKNDFILKPLEREDAKFAIIEPARAEGSFTSPKFTFSDNNEIVDNIIDKIADNETGLIDPLQIQIVCSNLERNTVIARKKTLINTQDIPLIDDIIIDFYSNAWAEVKTKNSLTEIDFEIVRKNVTEELVVQERRNLFQIGALTEKDKNHNYEQIIRTLVETGIIRPIPTGKETFYQLCHDRFKIPVSEDKKHYKLIEDAESAKNQLAQQIDIYTKAKKKRRKIALNILAFTILIIAFATYIVYTNNKKKDNQLIEREKNNILLQKQNNALDSMNQELGNQKILSDQKSDSIQESFNDLQKQKDIINNEKKKNDELYNVQFDLFNKIDSVNVKLVTTKEQLDKIIGSLIKDKEFIKFYRLPLNIKSISNEMYPELFRLSGDSTRAYGEFDKANSAYNIAIQLGDSLSKSKLNLVNNLVIETKRIQDKYQNGFFNEVVPLINILLSSSPNFKEYVDLLNTIEEVNSCIDNSIHSVREYNNYSYQKYGVLSFDCPQMKIFPNGLAGSLNGFKSIELINLGLEYLPFDFKEILSLEELNISKNNFTTFPVSIGQIPNLTKLNISDNPALAEISASDIRNNDKLKVLNISNCDSSFTRKMLAHYNKIESIKLSSTDSTSILSLNQLPNLKCIAFTPNDKPIPQNIFSISEAEIFRICKSNRMPGNEISSSIYNYKFVGDLVNFVKYYLPVNFNQNENIKYLIIEDYRSDELSKKQVSEIADMLPRKCKLYMYSFLTNKYFELLKTSKKLTPTSSGETEILNNLMP